jgi:hypothetical protein
LNSLPVPVNPCIPYWNCVPNRVMFVTGYGNPLSVNHYVSCNMYFNRENVKWKLLLKFYFFKSFRRNKNKWKWNFISSHKLINPSTFIELILKTVQFLVRIISEWLRKISFQSFKQSQNLFNCRLQRKSISRKNYTMSRMGTFYKNMTTCHRLVRDSLDAHFITEISFIWRGVISNKQLWPLSHYYNYCQRRVCQFLLLFTMCILVLNLQSHPFESTNWMSYVFISKIVH